MSWDDNSYQGDAYGSYGWGCDVVELEVDPRHLAGRGRSRSLTVHEIGKAIHPMLATGQIEGGSAQGLGYALLEDVVMRDGRMANASLTNYIIPTTLDSPAMTVVMLENPYKHGPFGAKGVGEMPIDGPAPAVINALRHAGLRSAGDSRDAGTDHDGCRRTADARKDTKDTKGRNASSSSVVLCVPSVSFTLNGRSVDGCVFIRSSASRTSCARTAR